MIKSFIFGIVLGVVAAVAAVLYVPVVDQVRERSIVSVVPNGGNAETFHVNVPIDRIMVGAPAQPEPLPPGLEWPLDEHLAGIRAELFKVRNRRDVVVGVASRIAAADPDAGNAIEWVVHLPARGSAYLSMDTYVNEAGYRAGTLQTGTQEFGNLRGVVEERWVADGDGNEDAGRIELHMTVVAAEAAL